MARVTLTKNQLRDLFGKGRISKADYDRVSAPSRMQQVERQAIAEIQRRKLDAPVYFEIPLDLWTENKLRAMHPIARGKHLKRQRDLVRNTWSLIHFRGWLPEFPLTVTMWRIGRHTDDDNLEGALKHVRDEIAALLEMRNDDLPDLVTWRCEQKSPGSEGQRLGIHVEARR